MIRGEFATASISWAPSVGSLLDGTLPRYNPSCSDELTAPYDRDDRVKAKQRSTSTVSRVLVRVSYPCLFPVPGGMEIL